MDKITLNLNGSPSITITSVGGDLRLSGWDQNQFFAEGEDNTLHLDQHNGGLSLSSSGDCSVRTPRSATLAVNKVGGDARVKSLEGGLNIGAVGGSLTIRQTGPADVQTVGNDLSAKNVAGQLAIGKVGGDLWARGVAGHLSAENVGGDLYLRDVEDGVSASAGGDVTLNLSFRPGLTYQVQAGGDLVCRLLPGTSARFEIEAPGDISVGVPGATVEGEPGHRLVVLGDGEAQVRLSAGGDVALTGAAADPDAMGDFGERFGEGVGVMAEELAAQIESQIEAQMADMERTLGERLAGLDVAFGSSKAEQIAARAHRVAQRMEEKAQRKADQARRKAARHAEAAQRKAEHARRIAERASRRGEAWAFRFEGGPRPPRPPTPPAPPPEPVSDEERMLILRMVEQGKISVAEAEKLLAALEARA
jgi:hypothetical protein